MLALGLYRSSFKKLNQCVTEHGIYFQMTFIRNYLCEANPFLAAVQNNALMLLHTEAKVFWFSSASAALPDSRTQMHKWISVLSMRTRSAPNSPIHLRQVIILLTKIGNVITFASAGALNGCHPRILPHSTGTAPHWPPAQSQHPSHIHPSGEHPHQAMGYCAQVSPPPFPGKAGPFPQKVADKAQNQATQQTWASL